MATTLLEGAALTARVWKRYKEGGEGWARAATSVQKNGAPWRGLRLQASPACLWPMVTARPAWLRTCLRKRQRNSSRPSLTRARCSPPATPGPETAQENPEARRGGRKRVGAGECGAVSGELRGGLIEHKKKNSKHTS